MKATVHCAVWITDCEGTVGSIAGTALLLGIALALGFSRRLQAETLGDVLAAHHIVGNLSDRDRMQRVTSYAVSGTDAPFLLAYYDDDGTGRLSSPLHVIRCDPHGGSLLRSDLSGQDLPFRGFTGVMDQMPSECLGSALNITELKNHSIAIQTHINPSAGCLLILNRDLSFSAGLWGWMLGSVADSLIFEENMVHFAAVHDARLSAYSFETRQITLIYPQTANPARQHYSSLLARHLPSRRECGQQNLPCDPTGFDTSINHVVIDETTKELSFDVEMDAGGFGEKAMGSVPVTSAHYTGRLRNGRWELVSRPK